MKNKLWALEDVQSKTKSKESHISDQFKGGVIRIVTDIQCEHVTYNSNEDGLGYYAMLNLVLNDASSEVYSEVLRALEEKKDLPLRLSKKVVALIIEMEVVKLPYNLDITKFENINSLESFIIKKSGISNIVEKFPALELLDKAVKFSLGYIDEEIINNVSDKIEEEGRVVGVGLDLRIRNNALRSDKEKEELARMRYNEMDICTGESIIQDSTNDFEDTEFMDDEDFDGDIENDEVELGGSVGADYRCYDGSYDKVIGAYQKEASLCVVVHPLIAYGPIDRLYIIDQDESKSFSSSLIQKIKTEQDGKMEVETENSIYYFRFVG